MKNSDKKLAEVFSLMEENETVDDTVEIPAKIVTESGNPDAPQNEIIAAEEEREENEKKETIAEDDEASEKRKVHDKDIEEDYDKTRKNLAELLDKGRKFCDEAVEFAQADESARAYEVAGGILKNLLDGNMKLMEMHAHRRNLDKKTGGDGKDSAGNITNNNAFFVGNPKELQKLIKNTMENK